MNALYDAAFGMRVRNSTYRASFDDGPDEFSDQTASTDLRKMVEADLLQPDGERRGRDYLPSPLLRDVMATVRKEQPLRDGSDPFNS